MRWVASTEFGVPVEHRIGNVCLVTRWKVSVWCRTHARWKKGSKKGFASWCGGDGFSMDSAKHRVDSSSVDHSKPSSQQLIAVLRVTGLGERAANTKNWSENKVRTDCFDGFDDTAASIRCLRTLKNGVTSKRIERDAAHLEYLREKLITTSRPKKTGHWNSSKVSNICQGPEHVRKVANTEFGVHLEQRIGNVCRVTLWKVFAMCQRILGAPWQTSAVRVGSLDTLRLAWQCQSRLNSKLTKKSNKWTPTLWGVGRCSWVAKTSNYAPQRIPLNISENWVTARTPTTKHHTKRSYTNDLVWHLQAATYHTMPSPGDTGYCGANHRYPMVMATYVCRYMFHTTWYNLFHSSTLVTEGCCFLSIASGCFSQILAFHGWNRTGFCLGWTCMWSFHVACHGYWLCSVVSCRKVHCTVLHVKAWWFVLLSTCVVGSMM